MTKKQTGSWTDSLPVDLSFGIIGQGTLRIRGDPLAWEIEHVKDDGEEMYRLTIGNLFQSESLRFPHTQTGLESALRELSKVGQSKGARKPEAGTMEKRPGRKEAVK